MAKHKRKRKVARCSVCDHPLPGKKQTLTLRCSGCAPAAGEKDPPIGWFGR